MTCVGAASRPQGELSPDSMKMALYGCVAAVGSVSEGEGVARSGISEWLPILDDVRTFCVMASPGVSS